jgi:hypothetical protein
LFQFFAKSVASARLNFSKKNSAADFCNGGVYCFGKLECFNARSERRALLGLEKLSRIKPSNARRSVYAANYTTTQGLGFLK